MSMPAGFKVRHWSDCEVEALRWLVMKYGRAWRLMAGQIPGRSIKACQSKYEALESQGAV